MFNAQTDKEPIVTMNLAKSKVNIKKDTRFDVAETRKALIGTKTKKVEFRADSLGGMQEWIRALQQDV